MIQNRAASRIYNSIAETDLWDTGRKSLITDAEIPPNSKFLLQIQTSGSKQVNSVTISVTTVRAELRGFNRLGFQVTD